MGIVETVGAQGCVERLYDGDGDGFGLSGVVLCTCTASIPYTTVEGGDCNDSNSQVFPGATEACNAKDDDCNGIPDEPGSTGCLVRYEDVDSDSYGTTSACVCAGTTGYALLAGDCADDDPSRNPGADEVCDAEGIDENCNGAAGEQNAKGCTTWYFDGDGDAWGIATSSRCLCAAEGKYAAAVSGDCNDGNAAMAPTLAETCDLLDNNCNGQVDEGVMSPFYKDNDGDLYGGTSVKEACTAPIGYAPDAGDCNDYNPGIHPGATEVCDDLDGDCDGLVDEGLTLLTIYRDNDGDGFASSAAVATQKCNIPVGYTTAKDVTADGKSDWDCNDSNVVAYPKADEICDGADNDCDGIVDVQCPDACPGTWPYDVSIPHHTPIRLIDLDGDSIDELLVIDSSGKLTRVSPNGTGTAVCPSLTFSGAADARTSFTVNPALGNWKVHLVQGTRIWDLEACVEVKAAAGDLTGFGVVGDWDGDLALDYAGHLQVSASTCFKRAATWTTSCVASPSGKPWDGAMVVWELDGDGRDEVIAVRGRTFPGTTYYDGY
ncbi:MAG: putative metal-binding motif-containing protein, partial [Myxococcales bacterium]|nr:putative metal-binding motif-containing protein [Myxococcales bacterium]